MPSDSKKQLENDASKLRDKIVREAVKSGAVPKEDFENLDRLDKLAEHRDRPAQWRIPLLAIIVLSVVAFLLYSEERQTPVELDAIVIESTFRVSSPQPLIADQVLRRLVVSSVDEVAVGLDDPQSAEQGYPNCALDLEIMPSAAGKESQITIQAITLPTGWEAGIRRPSADQTDLYLSAIEVKGAKPVLLRALLHGQARFIKDCGPNRRTLSTLTWAEPRSITMHAARRASVVLTSSAGTDLQFARQIEFEQLKLRTIVRDQTGQTPRESLRSALLSGTLYLDALNSRPLNLRPFEDLTFERSKGLLRTISTAGMAKPLDEAFRIQAHVEVEGMKAGGRSLMPSRLEAIEASAGLRLFWSSFTAVVGIGIMLLRYFKWI